MALGLQFAITKPVTKQQIGALSLLSGAHMSAYGGEMKQDSACVCGCCVHRCECREEEDSRHEEGE